MMDSPVVLSLGEIYYAQFGAKVRNTFLQFPDTPESSGNEAEAESAQEPRLAPKRSFSAPALVAKAKAEAEIADRSATWGLPGDSVLMPKELSQTSLAA